MRPAIWLALTACMPLLQAQEAAPSLRSAWVMAVTEQGAIPQDLKAEEWKVQVAGRDMPVKQVEGPTVTGNFAQNWALVFEPIMDPTYRFSAFQAAAQFLVNLPEGDRVLIVARTREGLVPLTPGLTLDRTSWVKGLEKLPAVLSNEFNGTPGVMAPSLAELKEPEAPTARLTKDALFAQLKGFIGGLAKAVKDSPYNQVEPRGVKPIERLGFDSPSVVRARLNLIASEMKSLERVLNALGSLQGPNHCVVFSRNDADTFNHPTVRGAMNKSFTRTRGDEGGPAESAELANRDTKIMQESLRKVCVASGVTLHSVAGNGIAFKGNLGSVAEASGGYAFIFEAQLPIRFGQGLQLFGSRYRLTWEEPAAFGNGLQDLSVKSSRAGVTLMAPAQR